MASPTYEDMELVEQPQPRGQQLDAGGGQPQQPGQGFGGSASSANHASSYGTLPPSGSSRSGSGGPPDSQQPQYCQLDRRNSIMESSTDGNHYDSMIRANQSVSRSTVLAALALAGVATIVAIVAVALALHASSDPASSASTSLSATSPADKYITVDNVGNLRVDAPPGGGGVLLSGENLRQFIADIHSQHKAEMQQLLDTHAQTVDAMNTTVDALKTTVATLTNKVASLTANITDLTAELTNVKTQLPATTNRTDSIAAKTSDTVVMLNTSVATLTDKVDSLTANVTDLTAELTNVNAQLSATTNRTNDIAAKTSELDSSYDATQARLITVEQQLDRINASVIVTIEGNLHLRSQEGAMVFLNNVDVISSQAVVQAELQQVHQQLKTTRATHVADVDLINQVLCDSGLVDFVSVAQVIDTNGAFDYEHFEIDGVHFVALANQDNDNSHNIPSIIYQWNSDTKQFEEAQSINTTSAMDFEHFEIDGIHFLAVANSYNGNSYSVPSVIYQWDSITKQFEEAQSIDTNGAYDWEHFEIDGVHFLCVANHRNDNTNNVPSVIYQWNRSTKQFEQAQSINTKSAMDWEHFVIDNNVHFLGLANYHDDGGNTFDIPSVVYQWNNSTKQFEEAQSINTNGAIDWEHFEIDNVHYLSVANHFNGNSYNLPSVIYQWNSDTKQFEEAQSISTNGAMDLEHFEIDGVHFLSVADRYNGNSYNIPSVIYQWNSNTKQFEAAQSINTNGAVGWEHFEIEGIHFLSVANYFNGSTHNIPSVIYQLNPLCV